MEKKKSTIKDIAEKANVSISTVSYVLNNTRFVGPERKKKVLDAAEELNYTKNIIAQGLRTKKIGAVGVLVSGLSPYYSEVISGMEEVARKEGYRLILGCTYYDPEEEKKQMEMLQNNFIEGIIYLCGYDNVEHLKKEYSLNTPIVVVDREIENNVFPSVLVDNFSSMKKATNYLINLGHRKILYVSFPYDNQTTVRRRYEGYCEALRENNIKLDPALLIINDLLRLEGTKGAYNIFKELLKEQKDFSAIMTIADNLAIGAIRALRELGLMVPEDVSVMGFGDTEGVSEYSNPTLSTIKQPSKLMGETSMNLLIDLIRKKKINNKNIILPTKLIIRESTKELGN